MSRRRDTVVEAEEESAVALTEGETGQRTLNIPGGVVEAETGCPFPTEEEVLASVTMEEQRVRAAEREFGTHGMLLGENEALGYRKSPDNPPPQRPDPKLMERLEKNKQEAAANSETCQSCGAIHPINITDKKGRKRKFAHTCGQASTL